MGKGWGNGGKGANSVRVNVCVCAPATNATGGTPREGGRATSGADAGGQEGDRVSVNKHTHTQGGWRGRQIRGRETGNRVVGQVQEGGARETMCERVCVCPYEPDTHKHDITHRTRTYPFRNKPHTQCHTGRGRAGVRTPTLQWINGWEGKWWGWVHVKGEEMRENLTGNA